MSNRPAQRKHMVEEQLRRRGIRDERVLEAFLCIPRERFVPDNQLANAYEDKALPIGLEQTISQPYIVAYMTALLDVTPTSRVLEIGTGSGYQTAILARLAKHVYSIERIEPLQSRAETLLRELSLENASLFTGDGSVGLVKHGPYDRILVTAAAPEVPTALAEQLQDGGRLVMPVGEEKQQSIVLMQRNGSSTEETPMLPCRFVKLVGEQGW